MLLKSRRKSITSFFLLFFIQLLSLGIFKLQDVHCGKIRRSDATPVPEDGPDIDSDYPTSNQDGKMDKTGSPTMMRGAAKNMYNSNRKHQIDHGYAARAPNPVQINPQNARHPELPNPLSNQGATRQIEKPKHRHKAHLPSMYAVPIPVIPSQNGEMYPSNPFYSGIPLPPFPLPPYNAGTSYGDVGGYGVPAHGDYGKGTVSTNLQQLNPSYRSGVVRGVSTGPGMYGNGQMHFPTNTDDFSRNPGIYNARGGTRSRDEGLQGGLYGQRQGMTQKVAKLQDEDDDDDESDIISGKFSPCGGDCDKDQFLCVGSCVCIPLAFRCDGDADCSGDQDELECGEEELDLDQACLESDDNIRCPRSGKCIKKSWLCDGDDDCGDFSDETHCDGRNCTETEFECNNGLCILRTWLCDGDNDCKDYSDEINCTKRTSCTQDEFHCNDGNCISLAWKCDTEPDCTDGSDEAVCPQEPRICSENEFECAYPKCVRKEFKCDGDDDCGDWSDEENCPQVETSCNPSEYKCNGGRCIPEKWKCDDEIDCNNGDDEEGCTDKKPRTCGPDEFSCNNGNCILKSWVCDNVQDCSKGEDEDNCQQKCEESQFNCAAHHGSNDTTSLIPHRSRPSINCIGKKHVCDGKKDCPRGEDEKNCPRKKICEPGSKCSHDCVTFANGLDGCSCRMGFTLAPDGYSCDDIDECQFEYDPVCSQLCMNTIGSFECSCMKGYVLRPDGRTCKATGDPPTLIFANRVDIRQVSLNNMRYTAILKGLHNAIALDFDFKKGWIYWSDVSMDVICRSRINGSEKSEVIKWGLESPGGVAIDWVHDLLYWTDSGTRRVEVSTLDGRYRSVIASNDLDKPRAIVTHPGEAYIFWTDWGPKPKIERSEMDGSNRKSIITESVFWPNGLTLDYAMNRIYWADAKHHVIECATFDGTDRKKVITKGLPHPFAITLFEDAIYWTDWHTKSISTANKDTGMGYKVVHAGLHFPMDIHSYHSQRQPNFTNHCGEDNGGCSHMCLPNRDTYRCVCPLGLQLHNDKKTCTSVPEKLLIFARKKDIRLRQLDQMKEVGNIDMVIPLDRVQSAVALAFDSDTDRIYWTDVEGKSISRSFLNGSQQEIVVNTNLDAPAGLAVDWVTKKLYWTDGGTRRIETSNLNGSMRALLIWDGLDKPRDITVDPVGGYMYWSDWGASPKIERAGMDGSVRRVLVSTNLTWPNGLAIDHNLGRLYWVDGGTKAIEYSRLDGSGRTALKITGAKVQHPFGLALHGDKIFWSDWDTQTVNVADKETGDNANVLRSGLSHLMDVRVFHHDNQLVPSLCLAQNGGCSHLCLLAPTAEGYSCACPVGIKILKDGKTCAAGPTNSLIFAHRVDIRQISLDVPYTVDTVLPLPPMKNTIGVDVDRKTGDVYWSDTSEDVIMRASLDGEIVENIIVDGLHTADGIVIDSTGRKIYWTDAGRNSIEVSELDGTNRKVLIWSGLENPRAITLHYHHGLMFWSDWGKEGRIEQSDMDGKNRKTLISDNLDWPNGLAIDRPSGRLYWNDAKRRSIESSDLQGRDRRVIVKEVEHPYGLVIVGSHIYWTDWKTEAVHRADKLTGNDSQIIRSGLEGLMDIRSVQVENIAENACGNDNGGCSHLCLRRPNGFSCACPTGTLLQDDSKTCNELPQTYLLFATRSTLARISLDTPELWDVTLPIPDVHNAIAVDYHWNKQMIYYTDVHADIIRAVNMKNISDARVLIGVNLTTPDGLAIDWLADNLYWTDTGRKVLEIARLDGTCRKAIITQGLDEPRAVALFPRKGYLYWTDWGDAPKIERAMLDGSQRKTIVEADLGFPNGLAVDYSTKKLYWADALKDRIEVSDLHGRHRVQLVPEATHPFGLTQFGEHIYWTDWYKKSVERADKTTGRDRTAIRTDLDSVMEIRAVAASKQTGWSPCQVNNGYCSHLCLFRQKEYVCACPDQPDSRPCELEPTIRVPIKKDVEDEEPSTHSVDGGTKSDLDKIHGDPNIENNEPAAPIADAFPRQMLLIVMTTILCVLIIISISSSIVLLFHRRRKKQKKYFYANGKNVLTFSNPNYTPSNTESGATADKKPFLWKKLKYDKSQERVYGVQDEKPEGISLMDERTSSMPPTPPERLDSINLKMT